jgi:LuxR family transcriptional regulator, maltose regulon positive regulatory protein
MLDPGKPQPQVRILKTKLFIPRTPEGLVQRARLTNRLAGFVNHSLVLVSAPAGSGKTTLLGSWLAGSQLKVGWVSLDERDNDRSRFWSYLISALQKIQPGVGQSALAMLQSPQPTPIEGVLIDILNDVQDIADDFLLVLDDYHTIHSAQIHQGMSYLLENISPQMHLVILSRTRPDLPISLLRVRGKLLEIGPEQLNFTLTEARSFLQDVMRLELSQEDIFTLGQMTEGWAAGLHLAALALQAIQQEQADMDVSAFARSFSGGHHYLFDYLGQEILDRQPAELQEFLLRTALLDPVSAEACQAVMPVSSASAQEVLEGILLANLFLIPLDDQRLWFRYHPLFSGFLRKRLESKLPAAEIAELHKSASRWYGEKGLFSEAVEQAFAGGDFGLAAEWIDRAAEEMFVRSELITLLKWLDQLPEDIIHDRLRLNIVYAWALLATARPSEVEPRLQAVEKKLGISVEGAFQGSSLENMPTHVRGILAEVGCIRSSLQFGMFRLAEVLDLHEKVQQLLAGNVSGGAFNQKEDLLGVSHFNAALAYEFSGKTRAAIKSFQEAAVLSAHNFHLLPLVYSHIAKLLAVQGSLKGAVEYYHKAILEASLSGINSPLSGLPYAGLGNLLLEQNELAGAEEHLMKGLERGKIWNQGENLIEAYSGMVRLKLAQNDIESTRAYLSDMVNLAKSIQAEWMYSTIETLKAFYAARTQDLETAAAWAEKQPDSLAGGEIPYLFESTSLVLARVQIALGEYEQAADLLERLILQLERGERRGELVRGRSYLALALAGLGKQEEALTILEQALKEAEHLGFVRVFLDEGREMRALLELAAADEENQASAFAGRLLKLLPAPLERPEQAVLEETGRTGEAGTFSDRLGLTARELEVLQLVAEGLTNQEISDRLYISLNTVKSHVKKILTQLCVENRTQAAAKAHELNLH